ncbi:hypothetical protein KUTeg_002439 [Tegillarca granosa]|uniref:FERM domain-containing protein n=1 Tax=Tegillarca granosa TaxID=220873 RepID=A0ABQ9FVM4_TEGGR|nr:hypothetical protein KUTeg_002439 [Tegillarca granosa]
MRLTANEALAKMLAIEKCEIVKINPLFGSGLPYKTKVNNVVTNLYWGSAAPDYDTVTSRRSSTASSIEGYHINLDRYRLHKLAADGNNIIAIRDFLKQGYTYVEQDPQGWTPMHWASWHNNGEVIKVLLEHGCSPNIVNNSGDSPLHIAARYGHVRVAEILLRHRDINLELMDKEGKTALAICEQKRSRTEQHQQIANLLRSFYNQSSPIQVFFMDGSMRMLRLAYGDNTTVHQLNLQLLDEYGLPERPYADIFTIWICSESLELQLKQEHKPMEHLVSWKRIVGMLTEGDPNKEDPILKWRRNAKIGLDEERAVKHPQAIHLLFHEAYQNYIRALYPCKDQDVLTFASILIYMNQKEFDVSAAKSYLNSKNLPSLVPAPMLKQKVVTGLLEFIIIIKNLVPD